MKIHLYALIALFPLLGFGQHSDIQIVLPSRFEFQKKNNEHLLNSLTKYLLEKESFKVFLDNNLPDEVIKNPCNNLKANIINSSGMFVTKLQLSFTDCRGNQVFISEIGKSREKEFKKAYQEALRDIFKKGNTLTNFRQNYKQNTEN